MVERKLQIGPKTARVIFALSLVATPVFGTLWYKSNQELQNNPLQVKTLILKDAKTDIEIAQDLIQTGYPDKESSEFWLDQTISDLNRSAVKEAFKQQALELAEIKNGVSASNLNTPDRKNK